MLTAFKKQQRLYSLQSIIPETIVFPPYTPASEQAECFHASDKHIRALFGGDRSGKTGTGAYEMITLMRKFPGELFWTATQTTDLISAVWDWHKIFLSPHEIRQPISWANAGKEIPSMFWHQNGSRMEFKTYSSKAGVFAAKRVKGIHMDEDPMRITTQGELVWNDCLSRILDNDGYMVLTASPILGKNWMYKRVFQYNRENREDHSNDPDMECWTVSLEDNRFISEEQKKKARGRMSKDEIERRFYGKFTTLSGAVFKEFDENIHVLKERPRISASWRRILAIDLGYENPFCCLWMAQDSEGCLYVYDEYYKSHTLCREHVRAIDQRTESHNHDFLIDMQNFRPIEASIADHEAQTRAELNAAGLRTQPADKQVDLGIQAVNRYLLIKAHGRPSLYVSPECPNLIDQMGTYHYKQGSEQEVVSKIDDHAVDALRYGVMYFHIPARNYRVMT